MTKRRRVWVRWARRLALLLVIAGVLAYVLRDRYVETEPPPPQTVAVSVGDIEETVLATGELEAVRLVSVGAQATGRIESLHVELGDVVKEGDLIAEIDSLTQQNALRNAEASLANYEAQKRLEQANLKLAEAEFNRQKTLLEGGAGSQQDYDTAEATLEATRARIDALDAQITQAEIQVDTAKIDLGYTRITAPMDGVVVALVVEEGQTVNAVQSAPTIIKLADLSTMTVYAEISEADVTSVEIGQTAYFTILGEPDHKYYSTVRSIDPTPESMQTESSTTTTSDEAIYYNAQFDVPNPDGKLRIAMTAEVTIVLAKAEDALLVPNAALETTPDGMSMVRVLRDDGSVEPRRVRTGITDGVNTEILSGLTEGERVITSNATVPQVPASSNNDRGRRMGPPPMF